MEIIPPPMEPNHPTEFEVQAYVYTELRRLGYNARGEVKAQYAKRAYCRFDIAIFKDGKLDKIVEIKRSSINHKTSWRDTRQGTRYNDFGVPVVIIYGMPEAQGFIKMMEQMP